MWLELRFNHNSYHTVRFVKISTSTASKRNKNRVLWCVLWCGAECTGGCVGLMNTSNIEENYKFIEKLISCIKMMIRGMHFTTIRFIFCWWLQLTPQVLHNKKLVLDPVFELAVGHECFKLSCIVIKETAIALYFEIKTIKFD